MPETIQPLDDKVLIKRNDARKETAGGILLPDTAKETPKTGVVVEIGKGKLLDSGKRGESQLSKGDQVVFQSYAGQEVTINDEDYILMPESDIMGIIK